MSERRNHTVTLDDLRISVGTKSLVGPLSLRLRPSECVGLVGESGSGKSLTALALLGLLPAGLKAEGRFCLGDHNIELGSAAHADLRGRFFAWVPQDPLASLHPMRTVGSQLREVLKIHQATNSAKKAAGLLDRVQLPEPSRALNKYPHEFSGGQRQRVSIAMALASNPRMLIADEPTSALDARIARDILDLLDRLRVEDHLGLLLISHDLALVGAYAQHVMVMQRGRVVESNAAQEIFRNPQSDYTVELLAADELKALPASTQEPVALMRADGLRVRYRNATSDALKNVSIQLNANEGMALIGESGSGKSTLGRALIRLLKSNEGQVVFKGRNIDPNDRDALKALRAKTGIVFQDPYSSLSPRMTIAEIIGEPLRVQRPELSAKQRRELASERLIDVGLDATMLDRYPHQFSGGQRQRIAIARALACDPELLVCDEAVSALDAHHRLAILQLLLKLKKDRGLSLLFITHDLAAASAIAERMTVLEDGRIVEEGLTRDILANPKHPHTQALLEARQLAG